ncbi:MAG: FAD-dependent oxidoreductase, partial [Terrimesophilobacter sp.]
ADLQRRGVTVRTEVRVAALARGGVTLADGETVEADHVVLATELTPQFSGEIVLATLVVDVPGLDPAPRGTGLLVAPGAAGIRAKALTHATAKWQWLARKAGPHRHILRLSYNDVPVQGLEEIARTDAQRLLGVPIAAADVTGFARVSWPNRAVAAGSADVPAGTTQVGESAAGTGLAANMAFARRAAAALLAHLSD